MNAKVLLKGTTTFAKSFRNRTFCTAFPDWPSVAAISRSRLPARRSVAVSDWAGIEGGGGGERDMMSKKG